MNITGILTGTSEFNKNKYFGAHDMKSELIDVIVIMIVKYNLVVAGSVFCLATPLSSFLLFSNTCGGRTLSRVSKEPIYTTRVALCLYESLPSPACEEPASGTALEGSTPGASCLPSTARWVTRVTVV